MIVTFAEVFDVVIMTLAIGFIFKDTFKKPNIDPLHFYSQKGFNWQNFWYACLLIAPSIIIHELAHKFSALAMGMSATFHAAYTWLGLGILLKVLNFGFIFFVPAFVSISGFGSPAQFALVSFAGPLMHLLIWLGAKQYLLKGKLKESKHKFWVLVMQVNKFLFILNMLPIPGFDGFQVYANVLKAVF